MLEVLNLLKINATNGKENFCQLSEKELKAMKELAKKEEKEKNTLQQRIYKSIEILEEYKKFCESKLNFEKSMHSPTANHNATYWKDCIDKLNYILSILRDRK